MCYHSENVDEANVIIKGVDATRSTHLADELALADRTDDGILYTRHLASTSCGILEMVLLKR
jgi:hypothetical protein